MRRNLNGQLSQIVQELVRNGVTLEQARKEFERQYIVASLQDHQGNFSQSAKTLGVHRNTLRNKVSNLGIQGGDYSARRARPKVKRR